MTVTRRRHLLVGTIAAVLVACGGDDGTATTTSTNTGTGDSAAGAAARACASGDSSPEEFPDVLDATGERGDDGLWTFTVTLSSPYDTPERYADGWRILGPDCTEYGVHTLTHDHANEQPFTRRQTGVAIPDDVDEVVVEGRDQANGFGGAVVTVTLDRS